MRASIGFTLSANVVGRAANDTVLMFNGQQIGVIVDNTSITLSNVIWV
jgi:hypothetical protein